MSKSLIDSANLRYSTIIPRSDSIGGSVYVNDFKDSRADKDKGIIGEIYNDMV